MFQRLQKRDDMGVTAVDLYVIDLKGCIDYPPEWRNWDCSFCVTAFDALSVLGQVVQELERRKESFSQVSEQEGVPCSGLDAFNCLRPGNQLHRIVVIVDEVAELTDTTGEEASAIVDKLSMIARLGRAFGVNLIVSTQRPDAMVVPGQIKNNLDGRVCGKADNVLSQIILDNTDAADRIPKDSQGLFLNQDGVLFQGYLSDDSKKEAVANGTRMTMAPESPSTR